jgi:hypothetical protein
MLDERKWGKMIESEVEERHRVVTVVRSVLGFWYRICRSCPWATKLVLTLRIPYVLLMRAQWAAYFLFCKKIIAYIFLIYCIVIGP